MCNMDIVSENTESTVISEYQVVENKKKDYQSEEQLEKEFIKQLTEQKYEYLNIHDMKELIPNLRVQLEKLNKIQFTDEEWDLFYKTEIAGQNKGIVEKTRTIQESHIITLNRVDGTQKNIYLLDKKNIHNNHLQVIHQYATENGTHSNRYDVTILVNGLPMIHIELKRRGVNIREAFNQINRYQNESFWADGGLFQYVQIFVISNGTMTKYYSNTTRESHIRNSNGTKHKTKKASNSFEFTSYWADEQNNVISDLVDFTKTFFTKHTILNVLTKYCVFTSDDDLMVMRPYQICATEKILNRIKVAYNNKLYGKRDGGGYIWHTTGSGKTLTSFKTALLASKLIEIDKVLFVVDRKDLDYQTMKEYDKFQKGAANSNTSTTILQKQLQDTNARIIITTIQKLSVFIKKNAIHDIYNKHVVMIFDECHRSQFGDMHKMITKKFNRYYIFGFTGTPIFPQNAGSSKNPELMTTAQAFGEKLHTYTIIDAIRDKNVLKFKVDYVGTIKEKAEIENMAVWNIDKEKALEADERVRKIVAYTLEHFNQKTKRNDSSYYDMKIVKNVEEVAKKQGRIDEIKESIRLSGFNSIFCTANIGMCKKYYLEFQKQISELPELKRLKIATIFSYAANEEVEGDEENSDDTCGLDKSSRDFLEMAIEDYNKMFGTKYDTSSDKFSNYYKDLSMRMKNREIDILIVVNMFLTGFDAKTLNTLWVDKNLKMHGLLQAFSRTNRILNSIKTFGNVVCFRNLEQATNDAIARFGDKEASGIVLMRKYDDYYNGYDDENGQHHDGYAEIVDKLLHQFKPGEIIESEEQQKLFIKLFGALLRARNIVEAFDQFDGHAIIDPRDMQDYQSMYIELYHQHKQEKEKENINDDIVFEIELLKQREINIDYILELVKQYHDENTQNREVTLANIDKAIMASPEMRDKKELIDKFIESLTPETEDIPGDWNAYVEKQRNIELNEIIAQENLRPEATKNFMLSAFEDGYVEENGTGLAKVLPPIGLFSKGKDKGNRAQKREIVLEKLKAFFDKFWDISFGKM